MLPLLLVALDPQVKKIETMCTPFSFCSLFEHQTRHEGLMGTLVKGREKALVCHVLFCSS